MAIGLEERAATDGGLSIGQLWLVSAPLSAFLVGIRSAIGLSDFWWHLRLGEIIVTQHYIPTTDTFSFSVPGTWSPSLEWLGEVYLYLAYATGGLELVVLVNSVLFSIATALVVRAAWERGRDPRIAAVVTMMTVLTIGITNRDARPQVLGFAFFALWYLLLTRARLGKRSPLWIIPPTAVIWANANGTVVIGEGLIGVMFVTELARAATSLRTGNRVRPLVWKLGLLTVLVPLAMLANPWGTDLYRYIVDFLRDPYARTTISEWLPPNMETTLGKWIIGTILVSIAILVLSPRRLDLTDTAVYLAFMALALQSTRNSIWFSMVAAPIIAVELKPLLEPCRLIWIRRRSSPEHPRLNYLILGLMVATSLLFLPWTREAMGESDGFLIDSTTPVKAVEFASREFAGQRFFHPYTYGSYMLWAADGKLKVFIDGRYNLYVASVVGDYLKMIRGEEWEDLFTKYGIDYAMLSKDSRESAGMRRLAELISRSNAWELVYEDEQAVIYSRRN